MDKKFNANDIIDAIGVNVNRNVIAIKKADKDP